MLLTQYTSVTVLHGACVYVFQSCPFLKRQNKMKVEIHGGCFLLGLCKDAVH